MVATPQVKKTAGGRVQAPRWIPPPAGAMKLNVDAAVSKNAGRASAAAVARDANGLFLGASAVVVTGMTNPETMEVLACREGLALAQDLRLGRTRLASDCASAVGSIKTEQAHGSCGAIIREIKATAEGFREIEFVHESRNSNVDAHVLAKSSLYESIGRHVWFIDPPNGVCKTISIVAS